MRGPPAVDRGQAHPHGARTCCPCGHLCVARGLALLPVRMTRQLMGQLLVLVLVLVLMLVLALAVLGRQVAGVARRERT